MNRTTAPQGLDDVVLVPEPDPEDAAWVVRLEALAELRALSEDPHRDLDGLR